MKAIFTIVLALLLSTALVAQAAEGKASKREKQMQRRMQQQVQQMSAERDAALQETATLKARVQELEAAAGDTQRALARLQQGRKALESELQAVRSEHESVLLASRQETQSALQAGEALQARLAQTEQQLSEEKAAQAQTLAEKKGLQGEKLSLEKNLEQHGKQIVACEQKNQKMYGVTREVIDRQRTRELSGKEPFFGLSKVQVENLFQEYEDRAYAEKIPVAH
jgi:chromosome segregation ATPase